MRPVRMGRDAPFVSWIQGQILALEDEQVVKGNGHPFAQLVLQGWNHRASRKKADQRYSG